MGGNGALAAGVRAAIQIVLHEDGRLECAAHCDREMMRLLMQKALGDLDMQMYCEEQAKKVQLAPAGLDLLR